VTTLGTQGTNNQLTTIYMPQLGATQSTATANNIGLPYFTASAAAGAAPRSSSRDSRNSMGSTDGTSGSTRSSTGAPSDIQLLALGASSTSGGGGTGNGTLAGAAMQPPMPASVLSDSMTASINYSSAASPPSKALPVAFSNTTSGTGPSPSTDLLRNTAAATLTTSASVNLTLPTSSGSGSASSASSSILPEYKPGKEVSVSLKAYDIYGNLMALPAAALSAGVPEPPAEAALCYFREPLGAAPAAARLHGVHGCVCLHAYLPVLAAVLK
jgi:hypothetical protein